MLSFLLKVLFLAVTIAFLGAWGMVKQQRRSEELLGKLYRKAEGKVIKELNNREQLSITQIEDIIKGTRASFFWSKSKVHVTDSKLVARDLMKKILEKGIVSEGIKRSKKIYTLRKN